MTLNLNIGTCWRLYVGKAGVIIRRTKVKHKGVVALLGFILIVIIGYTVVAFSTVGFIARWRTIYIETAMSTMTHQWLATKLLPENVVNGTMVKVERQHIANVFSENTVQNEKQAEIWLGHPIGLTSQQIAEKDFMEQYPEIDVKTLPKNVDFENLILKQSDNVYTTRGDKVYALDTVNGVVIVNITGSGYVGKLAIIKNPSQVRIEPHHGIGMGEQLGGIAKHANAIVAINGSGFLDPNGVGNGSEPVGLVISEGKKLQDKTDQSYYLVVGFDYEDNLRIGLDVDISQLRDAVQFRPALIVDGEKRVTGSDGYGLQPRSAIGQNDRKEVFMLIIDGRRPSHSIGATVGECADILLRYGVTQAINLDGGSSSTMIYNDKLITVPSGPNPNGRYIPNGWVVERKE